jgi:hypothetical protein
VEIGSAGIILEYMPVLSRAGMVPPASVSCLDLATQRGCHDKYYWHQRDSVTKPPHVSRKPYNVTYKVSRLDLTDLRALVAELSFGT